jgi:hypothetical protein
MGQFKKFTILSQICLSVILVTLLCGCLEEKGLFYTNNRQIIFNGKVDASSTGILDDSEGDGPRTVVVRRGEVEAEYSVVGKFSSGFRVFGGGNPPGGSDDIFAHVDYLSMVVELPRAQAALNSDGCEKTALNQSALIAMVVPKGSDLKLLKDRGQVAGLHIEGLDLKLNEHKFKGQPIQFVGVYNAGPASMDTQRAWIVTSVKPVVGQ